MATLIAGLSLVMAAASIPRGTVPPRADAPPAAASVSTPPSSAALSAALADAESGDPARHRALLQELRTASFLSQLDSSSDYVEASRRGLHVGTVLQALARNPAPSAGAAFVSLTTNKAFLAHDERVIALIRASVAVRPAPPALVRFWNQRSQPDDGFTPTTIATLVDNGSAPAIGLLEKKLVDPTHGDDDKTSWMRAEILRHRYDLPLLRGCERLLRRGLKKSLRVALVEVLFDYRPGEWFKPDTSVSPASAQSISPEALAELRKVGELALRTLPLNSEQKAAVERRLAEFGGNQGKGAVP